MTGLAPGFFSGVAQGKRINADEAAALAGLLSMSAEAILATNAPLDDAVIELVSRPRFRGDFARLGRGRGTDEAVERHRAAEAVVGRRARTTLTANEASSKAVPATSWEALLVMYLRDEFARLEEGSALEEQ
jgi:hypothetical protein